MNYPFLIKDLNIYIFIWTDVVKLIRTLKMKKKMSSNLDNVSHDTCKVFITKNIIIDYD